MDLGLAHQRAEPRISLEHLDVVHAVSTGDIEQYARRHVLPVRPPLLPAPRADVPVRQTPQPQLRHQVQVRQQTSPRRRRAPTLLNFALAREHSLLHHLFTSLVIGCLTPS